MIRFTILAIALALTWLIWSGLYKPLLLGLGVLSVALTVWLAVRMRLTRQEIFSLDLVPRMFGFWGGLLVDIVKSNLRVARIVLSPSLPISPTVVKFNAVPEGRIGQATLANSITLTPSTVTLDAHQGVLLVHCLTEQSARETLDSDMGDQIKRVMGSR